MEGSSGHSLNTDGRWLYSAISVGETSPATAGFGPVLCWLEAGLDLSFHASFIDEETEVQKTEASELRLALGTLIHKRKSGGFAPVGTLPTSCVMLIAFSPRRRQLAKLALIFSHMHAELSALFPAGKYCGHLYQLTKGSAHIFWRECCGVR